MRVTFAGLLVAVLLATPAWAADRFDAEVDRLLADTHTPSVSIAEIRDGRVVRVAAYGWQSPGVRATPRTLYNIASLSKPLSAEVILRLASQGRLGLDEPMAPVWRDPDLAGDPRADLLTPRLALSHRTGFPNWRAKTGLRFVHDPGQWGYSGEGYQYVLRFTELKTGQGFEALAQRLVLDPAGMRDTAYTGRPWFEGRVATPTDAKGQAMTPHIAKAPLAADLVYTTAADYARFMLQVMTDQRLIPEIARQRRTVQTDRRTAWCKDPKSPTCPDTIGMALGWEAITFGAHVYLTHDGSDDGVKTFAFVSPTERTGLVILTNGDEGVKLYLPILQRLAIAPDLTRYFQDQAN
jgi:CubicO group peptidase (beta-lactamase class C family)